MHWLHLTLLLLCSEQWNCFVFQKKFDQFKGSLLYCRVSTQARKNGIKNTKGLKAAKILNHWLNAKVPPFWIVWKFMQKLWHIKFWYPISCIKETAFLNGSLSGFTFSESFVLFCSYFVFIVLEFKECKEGTKLVVLIVLKWVLWLDLQLVWVLLDCLAHMLHWGRVQGGVVIADL